MDGLYAGSSSCSRPIKSPCQTEGNGKQLPKKSDERMKIKMKQQKKRESNHFLRPL